MRLDAQARRNALRGLWVVYLNVSFLCALIVATEIIGQIVFRLAKGYPVFASDLHRPPQERVFEAHPYLVGRPTQRSKVEYGGLTISTTDLHTRWTGAPTHPDVMTVAVLGGSSTFGSGVTDTDTWPALLQSILGNEYSVINFGVPGYSTAEAIIQMALLVPECRPRIVVFYQGWNDIRNYHDPQFGPDYYSHGMQQYTNLSIGRVPPGYREPVFARLADISAIAKFATVAARRMPPIARREAPARTAIYATSDSAVDRIYVRNLKTLNTLTQSIGARAIFIPQVLNDPGYVGHGSRPWTPHIEDDALPNLLHRFNGMMDSACVVGRDGCVVLNGALTEHWTPDDFRDDGHFNRAGGLKMAAIVARQIRAFSEQAALERR